MLTLYYINNTSHTSASWAISSLLRRVRCSGNSVGFRINISSPVETTYKKIFSNVVDLPKKQIVTSPGSFSLIRVLAISTSSSEFARVLLFETNTYIYKVGETKQR